MLTVRLPRTVELGVLTSVLCLACARGESAPVDAGPRLDGSIDAPSMVDAPEDAGTVEEDASTDAGTDAGPPPCEDDADCDDGLACNGAERCDDGTCVAGETVTCDDGVGCTVDRCVEPEATCENAPEATRCAADELCHVVEDCRPLVRCEMDGDCDDGAACNGVERCDPGAAGADARTGCVPGTPIVCDDGIACTTDRCIDPSGTCEFVPLECPPSTSRSCITSCGSAGSQNCGGDCRWGACVPPAEICNGIDDDCSGAVDNGFECPRGSAGTCTTSCGTTGSRMCGAACTWGSCAPPMEVCNGIDDDCNGTCDDGFACCAGSSGACTVGGCTGSRVCSGACSWGTCNLGAAPLNDVCAGTIPTIAATGSFAFSTCGASNALTASCGGGASSPDVIFRLSLAQRADVVLETTGASFDTVLHVRSGASCPGAEVACDDDGGAGTHSRISRRFDAGTHWVIVDGSGASSQGAGTLLATVTPVVPPNDTCATANALTGMSGTRTADFEGANRTVTECGLGSEIWYSFTVASRSVVYFDTFGSNFDTQLSIRGACGSAHLACVDDACGTLQDQLVHVVEPGTYRVAVHARGASVTSGSVNLRYAFMTAANGTNTLISGNGTFSGTTSGTGVITGSCAGSGPENGHYFTRCPGSSGTVTATTCSRASWDTVLYLRTGGDTQIACNDDACSTQSTISGAYTGPGVYMIVVDGFGSASGPYSVAVSGL